MSNARGCAAVAVLNGYIYIAGGYYNSHSSTLQNVELFDPRNNEWITSSSMNYSRARFALFTSKGYLYAMGQSSAIERFDPWKTRWTVVRAVQALILSWNNKMAQCDVLMPKFSFQIDASKSYEDIISSVVVNDSIFVIGKNGEFGELKIGENGGCSFIPLGVSNSNANSGWRHFLFRNWLQTAETLQYKKFSEMTEE